MASKINRAGQHLCIGITGTELTTATRRLLKAVQPGGIILFARNVDNADQLRAFTQSLRAELPVPPFIAIDQENERVNRLRAIVGELPALADIQRTGHADEFGRTIGRCLHDLGIDLDFAPVLDLELCTPTTDNALRDRCWGKTAAEVIRWAGEFITGLESAGVAACPKHFPGLGAATQDSHEHLPTITRRREDLLAEDVRPFAELTPRLSAMMVGHGHYVAFDGAKPKPASLSPVIIQDLLRRQLGFTGLVVTDDMEMGAITRAGNFGASVTGAVQAGADMVLVCHTPEKILAVHEALSKMKIPPESAHRLECFRKKWYARRDLNPQPLVPKTNALSS